MCNESNATEHSMPPEDTPLGRLLSELEESKHFGVANALHAAISVARVSGRIARHRDRLYERLLVCRSEITFARGQGDSDSARTTVMDELLRALAAEEAGAFLVAAVKKAKEYEAAIAAALEKAREEAKKNCLRNI